MKKIISKTAIGISWGCTILVLILFSGTLINPDFLNNVSAADFIKHVICSVIVGVGFTLPTIVYDSEMISRGLQTLIHLGLGFAVYFPAAIVAGWMPVNAGIGAIALFFVIALAFSFLAYFCFRLYYRKEAKLINEKLKQIDNEKI